jgi:hypothetical protein
VGVVAYVTVHASFGSGTARAAMEVACEAAGLDAAGARLIRLGENALFHLPGPNVAVLVARSMAYWEDAGREVAVARWLADQGFSRHLHRATCRGPGHLELPPIISPSVGM